MICKRAQVACCFKRASTDPLFFCIYQERKRRVKVKNDNGRNKNLKSSDSTLGMPTASLEFKIRNLADREKGSCRSMAGYLFMHAVLTIGR